MVQETALDSSRAHWQPPTARRSAGPPPCARPQDGKLTTSSRLLAGLGAGVSEAMLIVTPFEVVKTRLQQQKGNDKALLKYRVRPPGRPWP